jgi:hypothetical protein
MNPSLDIAFTVVIGLLLFLVMILFSDIKNLQTQVDELHVIVNQKYLPAMILEDPKLREMYGNDY